MLAGGSGSRLYPITRGTSKHLMPIYDKPMIYYPLSTVMLAGITDILVITTSRHQNSFVDLLGSGEQWGINISYAVQDEPRGLPEAFLIGESFVGPSNVALALSDNLFYSNQLRTLLEHAVQRDSGATVFGYTVRDPERFGVLSFDESGAPLDIEEKPARPKSNVAITGLYFFDHRAADLSRDLEPSKRGELEITDLIRKYMAEKSLHVCLLGRGSAWLDTGTPGSLLQASQFVETIEERQGLKISCPEEVAFRMGFIDDEQLERLGQAQIHSPYGKYLMDIARNPGIDTSMVAQSRS